MEKRRLGKSGPEVSLVGLGTNNFGGRIDLEASRRVIDKALELGVTLFDTADIYGNYGGSEEVLGKILEARRKDVVLATKFGMAMDDAGNPQGRVAALHHAGGGRKPRPAQDRLDRSLSGAPAGPGYADRGDAARARRSGEGRQGPLHRLLQLFRRAARGSAARRRAKQSHLVRLLSGRVQPRRTRSGKRSRRRSYSKHGLGLLPFFPARQRIAHRQIQTRRAASARHPARHHQTACRQRHQRAELGNCRRLQRIRRQARPHASSSWR